MIEEILYEIVKEAKNGQVEIDNETWPIAFNTIIVEDDVEKFVWNNKNNTTLVIKDKQRLLSVLEEYVKLELEKQRKTIKFFSDKEKNHIKWLITYLFVNATTEDFLSPVKLVTKNIRFLKDDTFDFLDTPLEVQTSKNLLDSKLSIQKKVNSVSMETPYRIDMTLENSIDGKDVKYDLPSVYYGIRNDTCYIYSIMSPKKRKKCQKKKKSLIKK